MRGLDWRLLYELNTLGKKRGERPPPPCITFLIQEIPLEDHKKMWKIFRDRVLLSKEYSFELKMKMLEKINNVQEELLK